jgi:hypothetical protein
MAIADSLVVALGRSTLTVLCALVLAVTSACRSQDQIFKQQREGVRSIESTAGALADAWLSNVISATFAQVALDSVQQLLEKQRAELGADAKLLADPRGAQLSDTSEHLSRTLAELSIAIGRQDRAAVQHLRSTAATQADSP